MIVAWCLFGRENWVQVYEIFGEILHILIQAKNC